MSDDTAYVTPHEDYENRALLRGYRCTGDDPFTPPPNPGWWVMACYSTTLATPNPLDLAAWFGALNHAQYWSAQSGERQHQLVRDEHDTRYLLVHPDQSKKADDLIESYNMAITQCNCGGTDCLFPDIQLAGARVFAKRAWSCVSTSERFALAEEYADHNGEDMPVDLLAGSEVLDNIEDPFVLHGICERVDAELAGRANWALDEEEFEELRRAA